MKREPLSLFYYISDYQARRAQFVAQRVDDGDGGDAQHVASGSFERVENGTRVREKRMKDNLRGKPRVESKVNNVLTTTVL